MQILDITIWIIDISEALSYDILSPYHTILTSNNI